MTPKQTQPSATPQPQQEAGQGRLPRGPHRLSREEVVGSQRERLLRAMAEATAERGYAETSVADVLARARVSRETFYQLFHSKQDCFIAAYEQAAGAVLALLEHAAAIPGPPVERFDRAVGVYLDALAAEPAYARLFMVEVYAAGEEVLRRRAEIQARFEQLMIDSLGVSDSAAVFACRVLVAGTITMVTSRLAARDIDGLRELRVPLVELLRAAVAAEGSTGLSHG